MVKERVMILGSNGFTGYYIQQFIELEQLKKNFDFLGVDSNRTIQSGISSIILDLNDFKKLEELICSYNPHYIVNFVGTFNSRVFEELVQINSYPIKNISEIIIRHNIGVKKIVTIGSAAEYGKPITLPVTEDSVLNPSNLYGLSKVIQSDIANYYYHNYGVPIIIARTFNIIGKNLSSNLSLGSFAQQINAIEKNGEIAVGNIDVVRDFTSITEVVKAYWLLLMSGKGGEAYNICSGQPSTLNEILEKMIRYSGKNITIRFDDARSKNYDTSVIIGSYEKIKKEVGWSATATLSELALKEMVEN